MVELAPFDSNRFNGLERGPVDVAQWKPLKRFMGACWRLHRAEAAVRMRGKQSNDPDEEFIEDEPLSR